MSFTWRSILAGREILTKGLRFQIGNGNKVSIWNDPWLPLPHNFKPFSLPMKGTEDWLVEDIIDLESKEWIKDLIEELFSDMEADLIFRIPLSLRPSEDKVLWHFDRKGNYNVKSGYNVAWITQGVHM